MPFRHLLFNKRNGAPRRAPDQPPISLESQRFFCLENEFPQASYNNEGWSDSNDYAAQQQASYDNTSMMHNPRFAKQQNLPYNQQFDHLGMFPHNTTNGVPYQNSPYDFDSHSLQYSSDIMDTDVSSISQGSIRSSISGASHVDVMFDEDRNSLHSLSRKGSVLSSFSSDYKGELLCPLITGQVGKCSPDICGPTAPCLQYVNDASMVPPIEECIPHQSRSSSVNEMDNLHIDFITPQSSPKHQKREQPQPEANSGINPARTINLTPTSAQPEDDKKGRSRTKRSATKVSADSKPEPAIKQTRKSRARQAHSLVERKYRENLNAKIQELHQTLQKAQFGKTGSHVMTSHPGNDDEDDDVDEGDKTSSKVKKSDVLIEAMNYVHATELELRRKEEEIQQLNDRITMMEGWMRSTSLNPRNIM